MDCPTNDFKVGKPTGKCWSNGHYLCQNCVNLDPKFKDRQYFDKVLEAQGGIQFLVLK